MDTLSSFAEWVFVHGLEFPGEDRSYGGNTLFVDLIPESCWFSNVRSCVAPNSWDLIRKIVYVRAGNRCEICGTRRDPFRGRWIEAHERWKYDDTRRIQKLVRLIALCSNCHMVTHFGYAQTRGLAQAAFDRLVRVSGLSVKEANRHIHEAFSEWEKRSTYSYRLDLSILTDGGICIMDPEACISL